MAKICTLASGSSGNSTYIGCGESGILIDAGTNAKAILCGLDCAGISRDCVKAIFITHVHEDHISALRVLLKRLPVPVFSSPLAANWLNSSGRLPAGIMAIGFEKTQTVADITVERFDTLHDSPGSSGFTVLLPDENKIGICTDLGVVTEEVKNSLLGCETVVLESNHDVMMLQNGGYPYPLKRRILSNSGHLSNGAAAAFLCELVKNGTVHIVLAHLSRENNTPDVARSTVITELFSAGLAEDKDYTLYVAPVGCGRVIVC